MIDFFVNWDGFLVCLEFEKTLLDQKTVVVVSDQQILFLSEICLSFQTLQVKIGN